MNCPNCHVTVAPNAKFCTVCGQRLSAQSQYRTVRLNSNTILQGRYVINQTLGSGGHGIVYRGLDSHSQRVVAVKALNIDVVTDAVDRADAITSIKNDAMMLGKLDHPNIVRVVDQFDENGYPYVVMELVEGRSLKQFIHDSGGVLSEKVAVGLTQQICSALGHLHQNNIIFRDMKPDNVMIDPNYNVKLIDFGIARTYKPGARKDTMLLGTVGYAPPEQHGSGQTSPASDIYALGVTLHQMVTGADPAISAMPVLMPVRQLNPTLSLQLEQAIVRATQTDPSKRWASAAEFANALPKTLTSGSPTRKLAMQTRKLTKSISNRQIAIGVIVGLLVSIGFIALFRPWLLAIAGLLPTVSIIGPLMHALSRRKWVAGSVHFIVTGLISTFWQWLSPEFFRVNIAQNLLGAFCSAAVVFVISVVLLNQKFVGHWKSQMLGLAIMGLLVYPISYYLAFGRVDAPGFVIAPLLGVAGWFVGDYVREYVEN